MIYQRKKHWKKEAQGSLTHNFECWAYIYNKHHSLHTYTVQYIHSCIALPWKPSSILCLAGQFGIFLVSLPAGKSSVWRKIKKSSIWKNRMKTEASGVQIQWLSAGWDLTTLFLEVYCKTWSIYSLQEQPVNAIHNFTLLLSSAIA